MRVSSALLAAALAAASFCPAQTPTAQHTPPKRLKPASLDIVPEIIFFNGVIYTGVGLAEDKPETVQAMAIGGGKVLAVGTTEEITRLAGPNTRLRDLNTANTSTYVFPGFNDAHTHLGSAGRTRLNVDLTGVKSLSAMLAKVETFAKDAPAGHWLTGGNWDHTLWAEKKLPTRQDLDKVTAGHPAFLDRIDGHIAIANSAALAAAGITGKTTPPQGGAIDLDTTSAAAAMSWRLLTRSPTASPAYRTSATGRIFSSSRSWRKRANCICASQSGCPSKTRLTS